MGRHGAIGFLFVLVSASSTGAEHKSLETHWKETGITFELAETLVTEQTCYKTERHFLACGFAVSAALRVAEQPLVAIPQSRLREEGWAVPTANLGPVAVLPPRPVQRLSAAELKGAARAERELAAGAWKELYAQRDSVRVSFVDLLAFIKARESFVKHEAVIASVILNTVTMVLRDPHTLFLPQAYVAAQSKKGPGSFVGVGVVLGETSQGSTHSLVVKYPLENGPAHSAGIRANDVIVSVDGQSTEGLAPEVISNQISGSAGTELTLGVSRKGVLVEYRLTRRAIPIPNVTSKLLGPGPSKVGYVRLEGFMRKDSCEELANAFRQLEKDGVVGLVFDLRGNGGGFVNQGICVANLFLGRNKTVLTVKSLVGESEQASAEDFSPTTFKTTKQAQVKLPLAILMDAHSASASEFVAAAVQDHFRGALVGERTYGKATVQAELPVPGTQLVMRQTNARFYRPSGITNQIMGVLPDLEVFRSPQPTENDKVASREEDEYMALPPLGEPWKQPRPELFNEVGRCVTEQGNLQAVFASHAEDAIPPDYQLLYAEQTVRCLISMDVGPGPNVDSPPTWNLVGEDFLPGLGRGIRKTVQSFFQSR